VRSSPDRYSNLQPSASDRKSGTLPHSYYHTTRVAQHHKHTTGIQLTASLSLLLTIQYISSNHLTPFTKIPGIIVVSGMQLGITSTTSSTETGSGLYPLLQALCNCGISDPVGMVLSHVMRGHPHCLLQSSGERVDKILLTYALSSTCAMC